METISRRWVVLNDHERKTLRAVEHEFRAEDPEFARIFEARQTSLSRHTRRLDASIVVAVVMLLVVLMVAAGSAVGAMGLIVATALFWVAWRHSGGTE
jgi:Flp pilus assembly protein TadB